MKKDLIVLPNYYYIPGYAKGLRQPLEAVAEALDEAGKYSFAKSLREAAIITDAFDSICITKKGVLANPPQHS